MEKRPAVVITIIQNSMSVSFSMNRVWLIALTTLDLHLFSQAHNSSHQNFHIVNNVIKCSRFHHINHNHS